MQEIKFALKMKIEIFISYVSNIAINFFYLYYSYFNVVFKVITLAILYVIQSLFKYSFDGYILICQSTSYV